MTWSRGFWRDTLRPDPSSGFAPGSRRGKFAPKSVKRRLGSGVRSIPAIQDETVVRRGLRAPAASPAKCGGRGAGGDGPRGPRACLRCESGALLRSRVHDPRSGPVPKRPWGGRLASLSEEASLPTRACAGAGRLVWHAAPETASALFRAQPSSLTQSLEPALRFRRGRLADPRRRHNFRAAKTRPRPHRSSG